MTFKVAEHQGEWFVLDDRLEELAGPFATRLAAYRWVYCEGIVIGDESEEAS